MASLDSTEEAPKLYASYRCLCKVNMKLLQGRKGLKLCGIGNVVRKEPAGRVDYVHLRATGRYVGVEPSGQLSLGALYGDVRMLGEGWFTAVNQPSEGMGTLPPGSWTF
ncbi:hypothetical protein ACLBYD_24835 [Rhodococcus sp. C26F]